MLIVVPYLIEQNKSSSDTSGFYKSGYVVAQDPKRIFHKKSELFAPRIIWGIVQFFGIILIDMFKRC